MNKRITVASGVTIYLKGRIWMVDLSIDGKRTRKSLKTADERGAIMAAGAMVGGVANRTLRIGTLREVLGDYLKEHVIPNLKHGTARCMAAVLGRFVAAQPEQMIPAHVVRRDVEKWRDAERARGISGHTVNTSFGYVRAFLNWCYYKDLMDRKICEGIRRVKTNRTLRETWTAAELARVFKALDGDDFLTDFARVLANTGLRPNELLHVRSRDFDPLRRVVAVKAWGDWRTKDWEDRSLKVNEAAFVILARRKLALGEKVDHPLFGHEDGTVRRVDTLGSRFSAKLPEGFDHKGGLYEFRHYAATEFVRAGFTLEQVRRYLGHADPSTTAQYYINVSVETLVGAPPIVAGAAAG